MAPLKGFLVAIVLACLFLGNASVVGGAETAESNHDGPMLLSQIAELRPKAIKRQLARKYGYDSEELARMIDKKDLIEALSLEQHKEQKVKDEEQKRKNLYRSIVVAVAAVAIVALWPFLWQVWEVVHVNAVVYYDKRTYEVSRCFELRSALGAIGVLSMSMVDGLQAWLSLSVALSWVIGRNKYFFPIPQLSVRPMALLATATGGAAGSGSSPLNNYGLNIGPMVLGWIFRFATGQLESWTGRRLAAAHRHQKKVRKEMRKQAKEMMETEEERQARRAARRARKAAAAAAAAEEEAQKQSQSQDGNGHNPGDKEGSASVGPGEDKDPAVNGGG